MERQFMDVLPLLAYVFISSFTPGPATISSSSLGMLYGFRRTLAYQGGLTLGVCVMMLAGGLLSASVLQRLPAVEPALRYAGAAYILYLAYGLLRASYAFNDQPALAPLGFGHGLLLNVTNPKLVVYAITVFSTFLAPLARSTAALAVAAVALAAVAACSTLVWALFGAAIKARLRSPRFRAVVNAVLSLLLAYSALELILRST